MATIGKRLSDVRGHCSSLNQDAFAKALGLSRAAYANYEQDRSVPNAKFFKKIADKFNVNIHWVVTGDGAMLTDGAEDRHPVPPSPSLPHPISRRECVRLLRDDLILTVMKTEEVLKDQERQGHPPATPEKKAKFVAFILEYLAYEDDEKNNRREHREDISDIAEIMRKIDM